MSQKSRFSGGTCSRMTKEERTPKKEKGKGGREEGGHAVGDDGSMETWFSFRFSNS